MVNEKIKVRLNHTVNQCVQTSKRKVTVVPRFERLKLMVISNAKNHVHYLISVRDKEQKKKVKTLVQRVIHERSAEKRRLESCVNTLMRAEPTANRSRRSIGSRFF
jgi:hypothetical protein